MAVKQKQSTVSEKYGIKITRPWNQKMYNHNNNVKAIITANIRAAVTKYSDDINALNEIAKSVSGYSYGDGEAFEIAADIYQDIDAMEGWWMHQEYPNLVKKGYCPALEKELIGY